jgi:hypothetical protein
MDIGEIKKVGRASTINNISIERVNGSIVAETSCTKTTTDDMIYDGAKWTADKAVTCNITN